MTSTKEDQSHINRRIIVFLQKIIYSKLDPHKESIDTKTYFVSKLLTLVGPSNVVAVAPCPIISAKFSFENFHQLTFSESDKYS